MREITYNYSVSRVNCNSTWINKFETRTITTIKARNKCSIGIKDLNSICISIYYKYSVSRINCNTIWFKKFGTTITCTIKAMDKFSIGIKDLNLIKLIITYNYSVSRINCNSIWSIKWGTTIITIKVTDKYSIGIIDSVTRTPYSILRTRLSGEEPQTPIATGRARLWRNHRQRVCANDRMGSRSLLIEVQRWGRALTQRLRGARHRDA